MIKLIIADDHQLFLDGITALLAAMDTIQIVATANNGKRVLELLQVHACDIVVMDINMPVADGLVTAQQIALKFPAVKTILVSMNVNPEYVKEALRSGVAAYVLKDSGKEELQKAIHMVQEGKKYFSETIMLHLAYEYMPDGTSGGRTVKLTQRELQVLKLLAQEYTAPEIAEKLFISTETVETHKKNMIKKLGLKNSYSLIKYAIQNGLI